MNSGFSDDFSQAGLGSGTTRTMLVRGGQLGPYQIEEPLGAGGMGEVFRAKDTRLGRVVAIKVLPHDKVSDPERQKRFLQEARAASALNHPNIVTLHDIANDNGIDYLVMEYVPGKSLDKIITAKGLALKEVVGYVIQIASALVAAHAAGIVHRDIKPANVIVTQDGHVKILDFGLAKLIDNEAAGEHLTEAGTVVGTVAYMSPEQASAQTLDHRTDIFSLSVMLYEMIAGTRPFRGKSHVETMNAIINTAAPTLEKQPPELQEIVDKALAKDPKERYQHAGDLGIDLRRFQRAAESKTLVSLRSAAPQVKRAAWIVATLGTIIVAGIGWWIGNRGKPPQSANDVTLTAFTSNLGYNGDPTISPDSQRIAYVSDRTGRFDIFLRQIGSTSDIPLTKNQGDNIQPSFSPDGQQIAFVSTRGGSSDISHICCDQALSGGDIWTMSALGGPARLIVKNGNGPAWSPEGSTIAFYRARDGIYQVPATGGEAQKLKLTLTYQNLANPVYSSDGRWIFFESGGAQGGVIYGVPVNGGDAVEVGRGWHPSWDATGQAVVFSNSAEGRNNSLWSAPFSTKDGEPSGKAQPLTVGRGRDAQPNVSRDGKLIAFTAMDITFNLEVLGFDAEAGRVIGEPRPLTSGNQIIYFMRFSPDGRSIVFQSARGSGTHLWRLDPAAEPVQVTTDFRFEETNPQWGPDGTILFNRAQGSSPASLWLTASDGANPRQVIAGVTVNAPRWIPDGSGFVFTKDGQFHEYKIATGQSRQITNEKGFKGMSAVSPDGKWLAYQFQSTGNVDVHATPMDGGPARVVVATPKQDYHPFFSPSGRWIYFQPDHKNIYRVPGPTQGWKTAEPEKITNFPEPAGLFLEDPQISLDGKRLLYSRGKITGDVWILRRGQ